MTELNRIPGEVMFNIGDAIMIAMNTIMIGNNRIKRINMSVDMFSRFLLDSMNGNHDMTDTDAVTIIFHRTPSRAGRTDNRMIFGIYFEAL